MSQYFLKIQLLSDTTFGRGDGVAGAIDQEVEHDAYGFPYLRGRTLKGLLREECDNLVMVLPENCRAAWQDTARNLFGTPGSGLGTMAALHIGDARLPEELRFAVAQQLDARSPSLQPADILASLTTVRKQTAIHPETGVAAERSLRVSRVVLRDLCFTADVQFEGEATTEYQALLAAGALALRRIGSGRNRGRGHVRCTLWQNKEQGQEDCTLKYFNAFPQEAP